jgi:hypothetical protein
LPACKGPLAQTAGRAPPLPARGAPAVNFGPLHSGRRWPIGSLFPARQHRQDKPSADRTMSWVDRRAMDRHSRSPCGSSPVHPRKRTFRSCVGRPSDLKNDRTRSETESTAARAARGQAFDQMVHAPRAIEASLASATITGRVHEITRGATSSFAGAPRPGLASCRDFKTTE